MMPSFDASGSRNFKPPSVMPGEAELRMAGVKLEMLKRLAHISGLDLPCIGTSGSQSASMADKQRAQYSQNQEPPAEVRLKSRNNLSMDTQVCNVSLVISKSLQETRNQRMEDMRTLLKKGLMKPEDLQPHLRRAAHVGMVGKTLAAVESCKYQGDVGFTGQAHPGTQRFQSSSSSNNRSGVSDRRLHSSNHSSAGSDICCDPAPYRVIPEAQPQPASQPVKHNKVINQEIRRILASRSVNRSRLAANQIAEATKNEASSSTKQMEVPAECATPEQEDLHSSGSASNEVTSRDLNPPNEESSQLKQLQVLETHNEPQYTIKNTFVEVADDSSKGEEEEEEITAIKQFFSEPSSKYVVQNTFVEHVGTPSVLKNLSWTNVLSEQDMPRFIKALPEQGAPADREDPVSPKTYKAFKTVSFERMPLFNPQEPLINPQEDMVSTQPATKTFQ